MHFSRCPRCWCQAIPPLQIARMRYLRKQILFTIDRNVTRVETTLCSPLLEHCTALIHQPPPVAFFQMPFRTPSQRLQPCASLLQQFLGPASHPELICTVRNHEFKVPLTLMKRLSDAQQTLKNAFAEPECINDARSQTMYSASLSREHRNLERGQR
jgi:hypothetical protein